MGKVTTWDSKLEDKDACIFIRGKFYHKDRDCYLHDGIYYSPDSRAYVLDNETGKRTFNLDGRLQYGVVGIKDGELAFGYFSKNIGKNGQIFISNELSKKIVNHIAISKNPQNHYLDIIARMSTGVNVYDLAGISSGDTEMKCMDVPSMLGYGYVQRKSDDTIILAKEVAGSKVNVNSISAIVPYSFNLAYNSEVMMDEFQHAYNSSHLRITTKERQLAEALGDKTFGIEYESWDGRIPTYLSATSGLIPLRDGSLRHDNTCGYEYASVIMERATGLSAIKNQCNLLNTYATFNEKCSMHIHIGNIPRTAENLVHIWNAFTAIQDDMFKMYPSCLEKTSEYKIKDYCNKLPKLGVVDRDHIVSFLSGGKERFDRFGRKHPIDPSNQSKWNISSRYYYCNVNNFYYTDRGTIELRISTPTFNHSKVTALLLIFATIIDNAIKGVYHTTIKEVIDSMTLDAADKLWLRTYCQYRKTELNKFTTTEKGVIYHESIQNDRNTGNTHELY